VTNLTSTLAASALALFFSGAAFADNERPLDPYPTPEQPTGVPNTQNQRYEEYLLALEKCQDLQEAPARQKCIKQATQKYNRM